MEATAEDTMYDGCHNDIRLSIDYRNIQILHTCSKAHSSCHYIGTGAQVYFIFWRQIPTVVCIGVLYLSGDGLYVCRVGAQSTSEPKVQDRPKPSRGLGLNTPWETTPK